MARYQRLSTAVMLVLLAIPAHASNPELEAAMARLRTCAEAQDPACFERELYTAEMEPQVMGVVASRWAERGDTEAARVLMQEAVAAVIERGPWYRESEFLVYTNELFTLAQRQQRAGFVADAMITRDEITRSSIPIDGTVRDQAVNCEPNPDGSHEYVFSYSFRRTGPEYAGWMALVEDELGYAERSNVAAQTMIDAVWYLDPASQIDAIAYLADTLSEIGFDEMRDATVQNLLNRTVDVFRGCDVAIAYLELYFGLEEYLNDEQRGLLASEVSASLQVYGNQTHRMHYFQSTPASWQQLDAGLVDQIEILLVENEWPERYQRIPRVEIIPPEPDAPWIPFTYPPEGGYAAGQEMFDQVRSMPLSQVEAVLQSREGGDVFQANAYRLLRVRVDEYFCLGRTDEAVDGLLLLGAQSRELEDNLNVAITFLAMGRDADAFGQLTREIDNLPRSLAQIDSWMHVDFDRILLRERNRIAAAGMSAMATERSSLFKYEEGLSDCRPGIQTWGIEALPDF